ncbi:Rho guanine nucleotide exchange factor [Marasmius crinis-equi]|uniref:Rho guanine nucleotide exchange factor n=1 Tax=Marasmius crinis-equi TaxID=585013 RepID=A0ABR3FM73_9AGAR
MTDDASHLDEEQLGERFGKAWTGYDAGSLNPTAATTDGATLGRSRHSQNRLLPLILDLATSSPVSTQPYGLDPPDGSTLNQRQLPYTGNRPSTHLAQSSVTEDAAPSYPTLPPPPVVNRAYDEDTPTHSPPPPGFESSFPTNEKSPAIPPPPPSHRSVVGPVHNGPEPVTTALGEDWIKAVPNEVLSSLPDSEINRQTIIHRLISKEKQFIQDLDTLEDVFIRPLRRANPPIITSSTTPTGDSYPSLHTGTPGCDPPLEAFIDAVFSNILDLRECNRRLLEVLYVRQREQSPVIQRIGDVYLDAATEFRAAYPIYVGGFMAAEKRLREEAENNVQWRLFVEQCTREVQQYRKPSIHPDGEPSSLTTPSQSTNYPLDLIYYLNRPIGHLQKYPVLLKAILNETAEGNPDAEFLNEAIEAMKALQDLAQMRTFQTSMGRGPAGKWEWCELVNGGKGGDIIAKAEELGITKKECKRQSIIFELIKGEMSFVKDLENISAIYIRSLRTADPPIIPPDRLEQFISDVFHNFREVCTHHRRLLEKFQEIQRKEHPVIQSITAAMFEVVLNSRDAYLEYIPHYPIAEYKIDEECGRNPVFKKFVEDCVRHPEANRTDMKDFVKRPIPRLLRYELMLKSIMEETPPGHEDHGYIPQVLEVIKSLGKDTEPGIVFAKQKVELWKYNSNIVFKPEEWIDMDLLHENRSLIHTGKLLRQSEGVLSGWSELFVLLFDNYLVMTKAREKDGVMKYYVNRRPILLDLLTLVNFTDLPTQRGVGLLRKSRGGRYNISGAPVPSAILRPGVDSNISGASSTSTTIPSDSRSVYPCTIHHNGRMGGTYILYAESAQHRMEWRTKLEEAIGLRTVVQESNKLFDWETLSSNTFLMPPVIGAASEMAWSGENQFTGKVTCSVAFNSPDGRGLVAIGCAEAMRPALHLKMVSQCTVLEDFGIFLVLADKSLFAYHIEALIPSSPSGQYASQTPQKLSGKQDVHFFSVGTVRGRTLVIYVKKKSTESMIYAVEPIIDKIKGMTKAPAGGLGSRFGFRTPKSDWFKPFKEFFIPAELYDLIFLKTRIAILCSKGFEIMDLSDLQSVTIPQKEDSRLSGVAKRCEACRPLGMFRSADKEFLLCYNELGLYVNKRGESSRPTSFIEWEGSAERVALHSPYILLFDSCFIEIRHIQTGRLVQIISGNDVRCLWDGRGVNVAATTNSVPGQNDDEQMAQDPCVHGVMNVHDTHMGYSNGRNNSRPVAQHVFELIPIPLYLPAQAESAATKQRTGPGVVGVGSPYSKEGAQESEVVSMNSGAPGEEQRQLLSRSSSKSSQSSPSLPAVQSTPYPEDTIGRPIGHRSIGTEREVEFIPLEGYEDLEDPPHPSPVEVFTYPQVTKFRSTTPGGKKTAPATYPEVSTYPDLRTSNDRYEREVNPEGEKNQDERLEAKESIEPGQTERTQTKAELLRIQAFFEDAQKCRKVLEKDGDEAQRWLDLLQALLDYPGIPSRSRSTIFKVTLRLSKRSGMFPKCLKINNVERQGSHPVAGGAFGDVWKGRIANEIVCLKVVKVYLVSDVQQLLKEYMQEAIVWQQLRHPNLLPFVGMYYLGEGQGQLCLVSPWMERGNLVTFLKNTPSELVDRVLLAYDVASGLTHLHGMKIVHADMKGLNVLITPELRACIGDFGLSSVADSHALKLWTSVTGQVKGSTRWLAPELLNPGLPNVSTQRSDIYAYGCIFAGRVPFYNLTDGAVAIAVLVNHQHPSRPQESEVEQDDAIWDLMTSCWNPDPSLRPTAADAVERIRHLASSRAESGCIQDAPDWKAFDIDAIRSNAEYPTLDLELLTQL